MLLDIFHWPLRVCTPSVLCSRRQTFSLLGIPCPLASGWIQRMGGHGQEAGERKESEFWVAISPVPSLLGHWADLSERLQLLPGGLLQLQQLSPESGHLPSLGPFRPREGKVPHCCKPQDALPSLIFHNPEHTVPSINSPKLPDCFLLRPRLTHKSSFGTYGHAKHEEKLAP